MSAPEVITVPTFAAPFPLHKSDTKEKIEFFDHSISQAMIYSKTTRRNMDIFCSISARDPTPVLFRAVPRDLIAYAIGLTTSRLARPRLDLARLDNPVAESTNADMDVSFRRFIRHDKAAPTNRTAVPDSEMEIGGAFASRHSVRKRAKRHFEAKLQSVWCRMP